MQSSGETLLPKPSLTVTPRCAYALTFLAWSGGEYRVLTCSRTKTPSYSGVADTVDFSECS